MLMLVFNWKVNRNIIFLALLIIIISTYTITYYFISIGQSRFWAAVLYTNLAPLWYLPGPLLFWYIRSNLEDQMRLRKSDWLHLLPFTINLVGIFPYLLTSFEYKLETVEALLNDPNIPKLNSTNWLLPAEWNLLLRPALLMVYSIVCFAMVIRAQRIFFRSPDVEQNQWLFLRNWMLLLSGILIIISIPSLILSIFFSLDIDFNYQRINAYSMSSATVITQFLISVSLLIFPRILYGIPRSNTAETYFNASSPSRDTNPPPTINDEVDLKNETEDAGQHQEPFIALSRRIVDFMEEQQPYLDSDFTLESLAKAMNVPKHHLYYCFQHILHTKFTRLRTTYRIEHAKKQLAETDLTKTKINNVGKESGFASTSAFYTTFKTEVGCSPGEFAARFNASISD